MYSVLFFGQLRIYIYSYVKLNCELFFEMRKMYRLKCIWFKIYIKKNEYDICIVIRLVKVCMNLYFKSFSLLVLMLLICKFDGFYYIFSLVLYY